MLLMLERESGRGTGAEREETLDRKWQGGQRDERVRERGTTGFLNNRERIDVFIERCPNEE